MTAYDLLPLANYQDFERMLRSLFEELYGVPFKRWGREGQNQNGVDIAGQLKDGTFLLVQAKLRRQSLNSQLSEKEIQDECLKAEAFKAKVSRLIVITTTPNDVKIHNFTAQLSSQRVTKGKFPVDYWGWGNVSDALHKCKRTRDEFYVNGISLKIKIGLTLFLIIFATLTIIGLIKLNDNKQNNQQNAKQLEEFFPVADAVKEAHAKCIKHLNDSIFSYSVELSEACINNLEPKIAAAENRVRELGTTLTSEAWTEINNAVEQMRLDYYQATITYDITKKFEDDYVEWMKSLCINDKEFVSLRFKNLQETANEAIIEQLRYYFILKDFIIPAFDSVDARITYHARKILSKEIPENLKTRALNLSNLMQERRDYKFTPPETPFSLSVIKNKSSRNIDFKSNALLNEIEEKRRMQVISGAIQKAFIGRAKDIETLIQCGVLNSKSKTLSNYSGQN